MSETLRVQEIEAYLHPHSHLYNLLDLTNEVNRYLLADVPISMVDIDGLAEKFRLPEGKVGRIIGVSRFRAAPEYFSNHQYEQVYEGGSGELV